MGYQGVRSLVLLLVVAASGGANDADTDEARGIIQKAIKAQGGEQQLAKWKASRSKSKGTLIMMGQELPATMETVFQLPDKFRQTMAIEIQGNKTEVVQVLDGDKGWISVQGNVQDMDGNLLKAFKEEIHATYAELLLPLLSDKKVTLSTLKETTIKDKPAIGVKVAAQGHKDIEFYFDKTSLLPVKTVRTSIDGQTMKETEMEIFYSDYKEFDGLKSPTKVVVHQGGSKLMEVELKELKRLDKLESSEFAKPK